MRPLLFSLALALSTAALALPAQVKLGGIRHEYQRLNNCGPATLGMALSFWGSRLSQADIAPVVKPNRTDKHVAPEELAAFARTQGYAALEGVAGDLNTVRTLLAAGFPVIVHTWFVTPEEGGMGHYRLVNGYDDVAGVLRVMDSFSGPKVTLRYTDFEQLWRGFGNSYLVVVPRAQAQKVWAIVGAQADPRTRWARALVLAQQETRARPQDAFSWFNLGTAQLRTGDARAAAASFDHARAVPPDRSLDPTRPARVQGGLPWRMLWYQFGPLEAYARVGRFSDVLALANAVLRDAPDHEEALYWRGHAEAALGRTAAARADFLEVLRLRPGFEAARAALRGL